MDRFNNGHRNPNFLHGQSLLSPIRQPVNESHQVDIETKSRTEILELLERQEKLFANKQFLSKLPDGGKKIEQKVVQLKARLQGIDAGNQSNVELQTSTMADEQESKDAAIAMDEEMSETETNSSLPNGDSIFKKKINVDELQIFERGFNNLSIHEGPFYDVVKQANTKPAKSKFVLNRQLEKESRQLGENSDSQNQVPTPKPKQPAQRSQNVKDPTPERLAKLISVDECRTLHIQQQAIVKKQQAELAVERLLARYSGGAVVKNTTQHFDAHPEGETGFQHEEASDDNNDDIHMDEEALDLDDVD